MTELQSILCTMAFLESFRIDQWYLTETIGSLVRLLKKMTKWEHRNQLIDEISKLDVIEAALSNHWMGWRRNQGWDITTVENMLGLGNFGICASIHFSSDSRSGMGLKNQRRIPLHCGRFLIHLSSKK